MAGVHRGRPAAGRIRLGRQVLGAGGPAGRLFPGTTCVSAARRWS
ncbi:hypothetical protein ISF6_0680 [Piscinibacter sakaiensis]|uniref:Uncharacterized protein n=1 Tax=Piscinibacter sakaiensis TaxID=1547922 RepID=A0A0K8NXS1_PISS1|nr:hypothetical protein ISF6_0680 [Piscinibacter sakaiensis]